MTKDTEASATNGMPLRDFDALPRSIAERLLGPKPDRRHMLTGPQGLPRGFLAECRDEWPSDVTGFEGFYSGLARRLSKHATTEDADAIRRGLQDGTIRAVIIDDISGRDYPIEPQWWRAGSTSAVMYWTGRAEIESKNGLIGGLIYLTTAEPETKQLDLSESTALCKLLLHLKGKRSAAEIAKSSTGTDYAVPERTVSHLLKKATELLDEQRR